MHKKLFIPGPTEVRKDVLEKLATPMIGHRGSDYSALQGSVVGKIQKALYTNNKIIMSTSSGTGLMDAAILNFTKKRVLTTNCGAFSKRWAQNAASYGKELDTIEVEWGKHVPTKEIDKYLATGKYDCLFYTHNETSTGVMNPIEELSAVMKKYPEVIWCVDSVSSMMGAKLEVDKLGVDFILASTQKAFALPPGFAIAAVTEKAIEYAKTVPNRGYYFAIDSFLEYYDRNQTPTTPAIPYLYALDYQLSKIIDEEGLENRWARHIEMANYVRDWAHEFFAVFAEEGYESLTVTCIDNNRGVDVSALVKELGKRGKAMANGYGKLKEKTFRIAHMGDITLDEIKEYLEDIEDILGL